MPKKPRLWRQGEPRDYPDDIATHRQPLDKTAALVVSEGWHFNPKKKVLTADSEVPLAIDPFPLFPGPYWIDLTGMRQGRLTVIGYRSSRGQNSAMWVCRCDCGRYTERRARSIKNPANKHDRCETCRHNMYLRRDEFYRRTGKDMDWEFFD